MEVFNESLFMVEPLELDAVLEIASSIDYYIQGFSVLCILSLLLYVIQFWKLYRLRETSKLENILFVCNCLLLFGSFLYFRQSYNNFIGGFN